MMRKAPKPVDKTLGPLVTSFIPTSKPVQGRCSPEGYITYLNCGSWCYDSCGYYYCSAMEELEESGFGDYTPQGVNQVCESAGCPFGFDCPFCSAFVKRLSFDFSCGIDPGDK